MWSSRRRRDRATVVLVGAVLAASSARAGGGGAAGFLLLTSVVSIVARHSTGYSAHSVCASGGGGGGGTNGPCDLKSGSSLTTSILNLSKNIIGAGMLSLPYAMKCAGVLPFLVGIVTIGIINAYSFFLLGWCCKVTGASSFGDLWSKVFGVKSAWLADLCVLLNNGLALLSYCVLIGDFLSKALPGLVSGMPMLASRGFDLMVVGCVLLLPLSLLRDLAPLRSSSIAGLAATLYGFMLLASDAWKHGGLWTPHGSVMLNLAPVRVDAFHSFALFSSAFMAHYNSPKFFADLQNNTLHRFGLLVAGAFGLALTTFVIFGLSGFIIFGFAVEGNVLKNYEAGTKVLLAWLGMGFSVIFTYPLVFSTFRDSSVALLKRARLVGDTNSDSFRVPFTASIVGVTVLGGTFLSNVAAVSGIKGAVMSACLAFVFPALMHLKLAEHAPPNPEQKLMRTGSHALIIIGIVTGVLALLAMFVFPKTDFSQIVISTAAQVPVTPS